MSTRQWSIGLLVMVLAVLMHAAWPRYQWLTIPGQPAALVRIDHWTGRAEWGVLDRASGRWRVAVDPTAKTWADVERAISEK